MVLTTNKLFMEKVILFIVRYLISTATLKIFIFFVNNFIPANIVLWKQLNHQLSYTLTNQSTYTKKTLDPLLFFDVITESILIRAVLLLELLL